MKALKAFREDDHSSTRIQERNTSNYLPSQSSIFLNYFFKTMKCENCEDLGHLLKNCPKSIDKSKIESITSSDEEASEVINVQSNTTKKPKPMLRKKSSMIFICYTLSSFNAKWL